MRKRVATSLGALLACLAGCGSVSPNADGGTGAAGTHATGSAGVAASGSGGGGAAGHGTAGAAGGSTGAGGGSAGAGGGTAGVGGGTAGAGGGSAGAGGGTAGAGGGTAGAGGGASGAGGGSGNRPCLDTVCAGACAGTSCDGAWTCETMVACSALATQYCGCDGKTFTAGSCAPRAYIHVGSCEAGVSCDTTKVLCKIATPRCATGEVPSVNGSCYGPCVPLGMCVCSAPANCPSADPTTCNAATMRCALK